MPLREATLQARTRGCAGALPSFEVLDAEAPNGLPSDPVRRARRAPRLRAEGRRTVAGAAILAGLGAGVLGNVEDARGWRGELVRHEPDLAAYRIYRELLGFRRSVYTGFRDIFVGLGALRTWA
jgi:hypothetical protein